MTAATITADTPLTSLNIHDITQISHVLNIDVQGLNWRALADAFALAQRIGTTAAAFAEAIEVVKDEM